MPGFDVNLHGEVTAAIAELPRLEHLELPADDLRRDDFAALSAHKLRSLRLTGRLRAIPSEVFAQFRYLRRLDLALCECDCDLRGMFANLPSLQEVGLDSCDWFERRHYQGLGVTKIQRLRILCTTAMAGLEQLADLPSLRHLQLASVYVDSERQRALVRLQQLQRIEWTTCTWVTKNGEDPVSQSELQRLLPNCTVERVPFRLLPESAAQKR